MSVLLHLVLTLLIVYCLASYIVCGYILLTPHNEWLKKISFVATFFFWLLSPLVMLDALCTRLLGGKLQ